MLTREKEMTTTSKIFSFYYCRKYYQTEGYVLKITVLGGPIMTRIKNR